MTILKSYEIFEFWNFIYFLKFSNFQIFWNFWTLKLFFGKFWLPTDGISTLYPWNIDPPTHGILNPLPMVYRLSYAWYFDPPSHRISTPYTWYFDLPAYFFIINGGVKNTTGVQSTIQGGSVFNKGVQYTMDVNRSRVQFTMGFKIPYDTGIATVRIVRYIRNISE